MQNEKYISCKYKKTCTGKDWPEHAYKCNNCKNNILLPKEKRLIDWPNLFKKTGWF